MVQNFNEFREWIKIKLLKNCNCDDHESLFKSQTLNRMFMYIKGRILFFFFYDFSIGQKISLTNLPLIFVMTHQFIHIYIFKD